MSRSILEAYEKERAASASRFMKVAEAWDKQHRKIYGKALPERKKQDIAISLGNWFEQTNMMRADAEKALLKEETLSTDIDNYGLFTFKIIPALMSTLISEEVVTTQQMTSDTGRVFWLNYNYGTTKSGVAAGDTAISSRTGFNKKTTDYSKDKDKMSLGHGDGKTAAFGGTARFLPTRAGSVTVTAGGVTGTDNGAAVITGTGITGTIDYANGVVAVTFTNAPAADVMVYYSYRYNWEQLGTAGVPQLNLEIESDVITTEDRIIRAVWSMMMELKLMKAHGENASSDLQTAIMGIVRSEIDRELLDNVLDVAENGATIHGVHMDSAGTVDIEYATPSTESGRYLYIRSIMEKLGHGAYSIYNATQRGIANRIVTGTTLLELLEVFPGWKPADPPTSINGPYVAGQLGRYRVIANPFYDADDFCMVWKDDNWTNAGYILAMFIPMFQTAVTELDDIKKRTGIGTSYATKAVNPKHFVRGRINRGS